MYRSAQSFVDSFHGRYAKPDTIELQASGVAPEPNFGGDTVAGIQAAGVLSFTGTSKLKTAKATSHFLVGGETVTKDTILELPEADFTRMGPNGTGQVVEATPEEIAAAQKASKK